MRAWLLVCAALALAPGQPPAPATAAHPPTGDRLEHIKTQILAKLGLSSRPTPLRAPPRDVVRKILLRAADPAPEHEHEPEHSMREIIAIAHRGFKTAVGDHDRMKTEQNEQIGGEPGEKHLPCRHI